MDFIEENDGLVYEAVQLSTIPEMKMVKKQVILSPGTPVGRGNMCFLYSKDFNQSIKMMTNNENFLTRNHYLLYFYPTNYIGKIYNTRFRYRETDTRSNYCDIVNKKVKSVTGYDRAVLSSSEKRNIFIDLHRYLEIFDSITGNLTPSKYIAVYWTFIKNITKIYYDSVYATNYPNKYMIIDLSAFTMTKSLKENLRNPLYIIFYTLYKMPELVKDIDIDMYFYNGKKILYVNPSHEDSESYKVLRVEMKKIMVGLSKSVIDNTDKYTDDTEIRKAENIEEPTNNIITKVYNDETILSPEKLLNDSPVNFSKAPEPSKEIINDIKVAATKADNKVSNNLSNDVKTISKDIDNTKTDIPKESESNEQKVNNYINDIITNAITNQTEEEINNDKELIDKIYQDLRKSRPEKTPSSEREKMLRKAQYDLKLGDTTIKDLQKINAQNIPIESHDVSSKVSGINKNMTDIKFNQFEKTYNEKLMKKDIVSAVMSLNDKSLPMYVVSIDVKDSSDILNYKDTYKIVYEDAQRKRQTITVDIPKFIEDKFLYINGNKMMIKHQSYFYPVVKVNSDTVHITTNYNKVIITRNDRKGVSKVERFKKLIRNNDDVSKLCIFGNVTAANTESITTIEYDDLAKIITEFKNGKTHIIFNQENAKEEANKKNISIKDTDLFVGYDNKSNPVFIDIKTGKTKDNKSITDIMIESLPEDIQDTYGHISSPKVITFVQCRIMEKMIKCGILLAFWEGLSKLLEKLNVEYRLENRAPRELSSDEEFIIFKDCVLIYKANTTSSLILSGLSDLNTKDINITDMDVQETYSSFLAKRYGNSQIENALMNFYEFLIDPITKEILTDMDMPTDVVGLFIYAINLLGDSQYIPEINQGLSRIRSNEIIPAMLYERIAKEYITYRNSNGRKKLSIPQNAVMQEVVAQNTVENYSTLNPFLELQMSHYVSSKGFRGSNMDRAYKTEKRSFDPSMTGTISAITSPDGNVGINKQLTLEPRITNARGYVDVPKTDKDIKETKDVNIFGAVELTMPNVAMYDDSTRLGHAVKQSVQCLPVTKSSPVLITNGFDEVARFHLSSDFVYNAKEDGEVIDYDSKSQIMIVKYKSDEVQAVNLAPNIVKNGGGGFFLSNQFVTKLTVGDKFKKDDVLAYHKDFFTNSKYNDCRLNIGTLAKVALMSTYNTYEDGTFITDKLAKEASAEMVFNKTVVIGKNANVEFMVSKGDKVLVGDSLIQFDTSYDDDSINALLANMSDENRESVLENSRNDVKSKVSGVIEDIKIYATVDLEEMSESLRNICSSYYKAINHKNNFLDKYDPDNKHSVVKCGMFTTEVAGKVKPNQYGVIKGEEVDEGVMIEFYIKHSEPLEVGSKIAKNW